MEEESMVTKKRKLELWNLKLGKKIPSRSTRHL